MKWPVVLLCAYALVGCSGKSPTPVSQPAAASTARVATPWDDLKKDEQRARDVQKTIDQHADQQRQQIEAQDQ